MEYFKDISDSLAKKYPDRKVFVISDHHLDHKNIINHTRERFLSGDINNSISVMNNHIITNHNSVVGDDDIVLILGDYSFKTGLERLSILTSKMNGHKFLILGNHDNLEKPDVYLKAGFEGVFLHPIKFNGDYYSHYPLNSKEDQPDTLLYRYLSEEFKSSDFGINFHGHQHEKVNNGEREKNVSCEMLDYKPLFVGRTKSYFKDSNLLYINDEFFDIMHEIMSKYNHFQESSIITDYLYTILLEILTPYQDQIVAFGSLLLNKKYNSHYNPSDLDITYLFNNTKSINTNKKTFMKFGSDIYEKMVGIDGFNPDFYKKIDFICILSFIYLSKNHRIKGFMDMHMLFDDFYKSNDFINIEGKSLLEDCAGRLGIKPNTIKYPRFNIQTTNALADVVNSFLQYIYTTDNEKRFLIQKKINKIMDNIEISSQEEFDELQNMLIRFLLRNIYFYERSRRKTESDIVLTKKDIIVPQFMYRNNSLSESLNLIVNDKEYRSILDSIERSTNRKDEITRILKNYK